MRVTNNMLINNMTYNLNGTRKRLEFLQFQSHTGKKFRLPSDDPIGASKSLKYHTDISKVDQYERNAKDAASWMKETEGALDEVTNILHKVNELTIQAANDTNGAERDKIKAEITELKEHIFQMANTRYGGRSIFTGHKTDKDLFVKDGDGKITYNIELTEEEQVVYNVGLAETVNVNTLGNRVFGLGDKDYESFPREGETPYLIAMFEKLETALTDSNQDHLQELIEETQGAMNNVLSLTAEIGARTNRLEITIEKLKDQKLNLKELLSYNEDVDIAEAYMNLTMEKNVYEASLAVGAKVIQPSLVDFLR